MQIGRPSNMPQAQPIIERLMEEAKPYNRVYIASIHPDLNENDIQRLWIIFFLKSEEPVILYLQFVSLW